MDTGLPEPLLPESQPFWSVPLRLSCVLGRLWPLLLQWASPSVWVCTRCVVPACRHAEVHSKPDGGGCLFLSSQWNCGPRLLLAFAGEQGLRKPRTAGPQRTERERLCSQLEHQGTKPGSTCCTAAESPASRAERWGWNCNFAAHPCVTLSNFLTHSVHYS
jgi:hypothetical protein